MSTITKTARVVNAATDEASTSSSIMIGVALRVRGNPKRYQALNLRESEAPTLLFVNEDYTADEPQLGGLIEFGNHTYTIRDVDVLAPDGFVILAKLIVSR